MLDSLAGWEHRLRPLLVRMPPAMAVRFYSLSRRKFVAALARQPPRQHRTVKTGRFETKLWDLHFRSPLFGAAGMFKTGSGYRLVDRQGAGAFLAGTVTSTPRTGNRRGGVFLPFAPYPDSGAASNWLGLPNPGHEVVAKRLAGIERSQGCPVGVSVAALAEIEGDLESLGSALCRYEEIGVDFIELNESCPNTPCDIMSERAASSIAQLRQRLEVIRELFLVRRQRYLPVVVKFSCDADRTAVGELIALLLELGFDGVNFGNTSIAYDRHRPAVTSSEQALYDYFCREFGGGLSGTVLRDDSAALSSAAVESLRSSPADREFHVIRTGGVSTAGDVAASVEAGVSLCQWFTGYFESFANHGHSLYPAVLTELERILEHG